MSVMYSLPGIYNVLDTSFAGGMAAGGLASTQNTLALQAAIDTAQADINGGIVLIPTTGPTTSNIGPYRLLPPTSATAFINIPSVQAQPILICGTGGGATLQPQSGGIPLFNVTDSDGLTFQDLTIDYEPAPFSPAAAFSITGGTGYNFSRLTIKNYPTPFQLNATRQVYIFQCYVFYTGDYPAANLNVVQIGEGSSETWIDQCLFKFNGQADSSQVALAIGESSLTRVTNCQIEAFQHGVQMGTSAGTVQSTAFINTRIATAPSGLDLQINAGVYDAQFIGCHFQSGTADDVVYMGQCIVIDPSDGLIDTVIFKDCSSRDSIDYGIEIRGGQNIQILGGTYAGNNPMPVIGATSAGIAITGGAVKVQIDGASCTGTTDSARFGPQVYGIYIIAGTDIEITNVNCSGNGNSNQAGAGIHISGSASQITIRGAICNTPVLNTVDYQANGIEIDGVSNILIGGCQATGNIQFGIYLNEVSNVTISSCDVYGNQTGGISLSGGSSESQNVYIRDCNITGYSFPHTIMISGTLSNIQVTDCAGYNDQARLILSSPPPSGLVFVGGSHWNYYGPISFYISGMAAVQIDMQPTGLTSGGFTVQPGESCAVFYSLTPPLFVMFGN